MDGPVEFYHENGQLQGKSTGNVGEKCGEWIIEGETVPYPPLLRRGLEDGN
jgi:antitoxin component YwqK of YwqJK toxin-antitoxin module